MKNKANVLPDFPMGGIHPTERKELTEYLPIEVMPDPSKVALFLKQHVGYPSEVMFSLISDLHSPEYYLEDNICKDGACSLDSAEKKQIKVGELIGSTKNRIGANLHAGINGTVEGVFDTIHPVLGKAPAIIVSKNSDDDQPTFTKKDWTQYSREELLSKIKAAGIVGLGGAGFPADIKLNVKPEVFVDTLILNGSECEPYLTCDHRVMAEYPKEIIEGAKIILKILGINRCVIGIEDNKPDAIAALEQAVINDQNKMGSEIFVQPLTVKYPHGSADQIMESVTGRVRPSGKRSSSIGIIVQNVYTTKTIYDAVVLDKPFYERVVTISGRGIARQANLQVKIGTKLADIVEYLGGTTPDLAKIVIGGPMMGVAVSSLNVPITKAISGILFLTKEELGEEEKYGPCIRCGFCIDACPMGLEPNNIGVFVEAGKGAECEQFGFVNDCFQCGSCAYVCPAKRPLVQFIGLARIKLEEAKKKEEN